MNEKALKITEAEKQYKGKEWYDGEPWSKITKVVPLAYKTKSYFILLIGKTHDYDVVAIIDRFTGENMIPFRCRPADSIDDAIDVAMEMLG